MSNQQTIDGYLRASTEYELDIIEKALKRYEENSPADAFNLTTIIDSIAPKHIVFFGKTTHLDIKEDLQRLLASLDTHFLTYTGDIFMWSGNSEKTKYSISNGILLDSPQPVT